VAGKVQCKRLYDEKLRRHIYGTRTKSPQISANLQEQGYLIYHRKSHFLCRAPERTVLDISNVIMPYEFDIEFPLRAWRFLQEQGQHLVEQLAASAQGEACILRDPLRECQFRIAATSKTGLDALCTSLEDTLREHCRPSLEPRRGEKALIPNISIEKLSQNERSRLSKLRRAYRAWVLPNCPTVPGLLSCTAIVHHPVWKSVLELGYAPVFVLHDGVPYGLGYEHTTGSQVTFVEYHHGGDPHANCRPKRVPEFLWIGERPRGSRLVLLDRTVSGESLLSMRERLYPTTVVAMLPKSRAAVAIADYIIFDGCLVKVEKVSRHAEWFLELYQTLNSWTEGWRGSRG